MFNNLKKLISLVFATVLLTSISSTSFAIDKLHFIIGGGAGGGWDGTARGTGEALTKAGFLKSASFENMSGGGGGKALSYIINSKPEGTILVQSTPLVLRSITRHKGYVKGSGVLSYKDVKPIAGVIGDYGAIAVAKNSPYKNFKDVVDAYKANPKSIKMAGGSVRGSMDHLIGALAFQEAGANPNNVVYVPYDAGGKALAGLLSGEENSDEISQKKMKMKFASNNAGGILGGISSGQEIIVSFAVKPTSSILKSRKTINKFGKNTTISVKGRHDPCVGIRAVPVGEAMLSCVLLDHYLMNKGQCS